MIKLTKQELDKIKPINNMVLVQPLEDRSQYELTKEVKLQLETEFTEDAFRYIPVINKVIAVPNNIKFGQGFSEWETTVELTVGDTVVVNQLPLQLAQNDKQFILCEGVRYFWIKYSDIYCKQKLVDVRINSDTDENGIGFDSLYKLTPINGYVICEPVIDEIKYIEHVVKKESKQCAVVKFVGSLNTNHLERWKPESESFYTPSDMEVEVGDIVYFKKYRNRRLDNGLKKTFGTLMPIKRSDILYIKRGDLIIG